MDVITYPFPDHNTGFSKKGGPRSPTAKTQKRIISQTNPVPYGMYQWGMQTIWLLYHIYLCLRWVDKQHW